MYFCKNSGQYFYVALLMIINTSLEIETARFPLTFLLQIHSRWLGSASLHRDWLSSTVKFGVDATHHETTEATSRRFIRWAVSRPWRESQKFVYMVVVPICLSLVFKFYSWFLCVTNLPAVMYVCHMRTWCPWRPEMGIRFPGTYITGSCEFMSVQRTGI